MTLKDKWEKTKDYARSIFQTYLAHDLYKVGGGGWSQQKTAKMRQLYNSASHDSSALLALSSIFMQNNAPQLATLPVNPQYTVDLDLRL